MYTGEYSAKRRSGAAVETSAMVWDEFLVSACVLGSLPGDVARASMDHHREGICSFDVTANIVRISVKKRAQDNLLPINMKTICRTRRHAR